MKFKTIMAAGIFLVGSSVAFADSPEMNHYDVMQDELWHGAATALVPTTASSEKTSVKNYSREHYDVIQDELWHGAETAPIPTTTPSGKASVKDYSREHYDVMQDEFWHGA